MNYINNFFTEHGHNHFKEKVVLRFNKRNKVWQVLKTLGLTEEVLFENKDKELCKSFLNIKN